MHLIEAQGNAVRFCVLAPNAWLTEWSRTCLQSRLNWFDPSTMLQITLCGGTVDTAVSKAADSNIILVQIQVERPNAGMGEW